MTHTLVIDESGGIRFIHSDELIPLRDALGKGVTKRASNVEPDSNGEWSADLSPVNGPVIGPFTTRQEALDAEIAWLKTNHIPFPENKNECK